MQLSVEQQGVHHRDTETQLDAFMSYKLCLCVSVVNTLRLSPSPALQHEAEVRIRETVEQWEDCREVARGEPVPRREGGRVLLDGGRRYPASARVGVVGAAERERRVGA